MSASDCRGALLRLIAEADQDREASALPNVSTPPDDVAAFSAQHGLHPAFTYLVASLSLNDPANWREIVGPLAGGADTAAVTRNWIKWVWSDPADGLRERMTDGDLKAAGDAVCDMHRRAGVGEKIARQAWREVRTKLGRAGDEDELQKAAADGAAAVAWDLDSVPAAAADMVYPWMNTFFAEIDRSIGWNAEKEAAATERGEQINAAGLAAATRATPAVVEHAAGPDGETAPPPFDMDAYQKATADFVADNPSDLDQRGDLRGAAWSKAYRLGREGLRRQIEAAG